MSSHHYDREPDADSPQLDLEIEPIHIRQADVDDDASRPINRRRAKYDGLVLLDYKKGFLLGAAHAVHAGLEAALFLQLRDGLQRIPQFQSDHFA
jgi:hypothetical protein